MKKILALSAALSLLALPAMAASDYNKGHSDHHDQQDQSRSRYDNTSRNQNGHAQKQSASRHQYNYDGKWHDSYRAQAWRAPYGHDASRHWRNGDRLPPAYRDRAYVVNYRTYDLSRPPYGYEWVRVSNSVFLVRQSNGLISNIVINLFY